MTSTANLADRVRELVRDELSELIAIRHDIHAHPELGYEERRTAELVERQLGEVGVQFRAGLALGTGLVGHLPGRAPTAIGLRADMDALPIQEETGLPYASKHPGVMHACGHDGHTTILIGAARVLAKLAAEDELPRPVTFVFQPAEEGGGGGEKMVEDGCLDASALGGPVEMMFGLHGWPIDPLGIVTTRVGPMLAAADMFEISIRGLGTHAAMPHRGHDPIVAGAAMVSALQTIASREIDPLDSIVVSVTQFTAGTAHNIIPQTAILRGTVRTLLPDTQQLAMRRLEEISSAIAQAHGCRAELDYHLGYPVTRNDADAVAIFDEVARDTLGPEHVRHMDHPVMGGEDFAYYGQKVPACFFTLGLCPTDTGSYPNVHHPKFDFNDDAIATGVEMFCRLALRS